jgi:hypothetical protein
MDGSHTQLVLHQFAEVRHGEVVRTRQAAVLGAAFLAVLPAHAIAVVTVGDEHGARGDRGADGRAALGVVDALDGVRHAVVIDGRPEWRARLEQEPGEASGQGQPPDRGEVGVCRAGELEPVGRGLRRGPFVGEHAVAVGRFRAFGCHLERSDDADGRPGPPGIVGEHHAVERERRMLVVLQDALVPPLLERECRPLVASRAVGLGRHVDPDDVGLVADGQVVPLGLRQHVVGRRDDVVEVDPRGVVAQTDEGLEAGHGRQGWHAVMAASSP